MGLTTFSGLTGFPGLTRAAGLTWYPGLVDAESGNTVVQELLWGATFMAWDTQLFVWGNEP